MKKDLLLPHSFRLVGWLLVIPSVLLGLANMYAEYKPAFLGDFTDETAALGVIVGLLFVAFAREKVEDEMIRQLRLESLQWSVYINYVLLAIAIVLLYDTAFFNVMIYNMFTILVVFIGRFAWLLYKLQRREETFV